MQIAQSLKPTQSPKSIQNLKLFKIQRTGVYDGPGVRTTLFFQGCNLRCLWCQNPEGQSFQGGLVPECNYSNEEIMDIVLRDKEYYSATNGGVTLSGGEPLLQDPDNLIELLKLLKEENISIAAETTLHVPWKNVKKIAPYIDLFLVDLKVVGDDDLHVKLTKQTSTLIHSNITKLLELNANIKFRMVMVPGLNDSESNIITAADFLKSINYDSIELLKYHNIYEEKAKRLGLIQETLNISPEQSLASIQKALDLFKNYGINAENADLDSSRHQANFTQRVIDIQKAIRESPRTLCIEVSKLKTKYYKKNGFKKPNPLHRAERLSYILQNKKVIIYPQELLVGNFTSKRVGSQLWEELNGALPWAFVIWNLNRQKPVPFQFSFKDMMYFYFNFVSFWWGHSVTGKIYPLFTKQQLLMMARTAENVAGFNNNMVMIAHFIENFERILTLGTSGIIEEIKAVQKEKPENNQDFYNGAIIGLQGLEAFAQRYADNLTNLSNTEENPDRLKELEEMAEVCQNVPKNPARTYHEALQSMLFLHIALCIESFENAISFGRLDQILYPYYKKDKDAGRITYDKAKELLALFILKMDEIVVVNDGNSILSMSKNFESLSVDQTVTFGGVDKDGKDATNDITYMLIDICELQPLAVDPSARIHKDSPPEYLQRLAEVYIDGCPMPKLNNDKIYIETIQKHYPVTLEQARNYSIVGCVEPAVSNDHFGNTDCANVNLALPFLQALKGQEYDLWIYDYGDIFEKMNTNTLEYFFGGNGKISKAILSHHYKTLKSHARKKGRYIYNPPSSMDELLESFQTRLNIVTKSILIDHQKIEKLLRENYTTPLASSLSEGCIESGKDLYEGGAKINSSGIQALGVVDVADSLYSLNEVVFKKKLYTMNDVLNAIDNNFEGEINQQIRAALLAVPKFGDDSSHEPADWVNTVMAIYNNALESVENCPRNGRYSAGYYALNVSNRYGRKTQALPSGRLDGVPLANSIIPHFGMEQADLLSSLNAIAGVNFTEHAENGATCTFTIDPALFQGADGTRNLANIFKTFITGGGIQIQPNVVNREILVDAYNHPENHKYLMVRIAGYCAYFNELSEELKLSIINRTYYS